MSKKKPENTSQPTDIEVADQIDSDASNDANIESSVVQETDQEDRVRDGAVESAETPKVTEEIESAAPVKTRKHIPVLGIVNLLLIFVLIAAAAYYWDQLQKLQQVDEGRLQKIVLLQQELGQKVDGKQIRSRIAPLETAIDKSTRQLDALQKGQQALQGSTDKLFELYGRDENAWQLAEVEYLLRIGQHKLILENDFEGAALTLQAASNKIAEMNDPGLLPVRVQISDEIAILKTRTRPDLVGMTLLLTQLGRQIHTLKPGYQPLIEISETSSLQPKQAAPVDQDIGEQVKGFLSSLVSIKHKKSHPSTIEAQVVDVDETLEASLKLTRWAVLERDEFQFRKLMQDNLNLFKQYYDLENAANNDFFASLQQLQKTQIKPEQPDISQSLERLKHIISKRQNAPIEVKKEDAANG